MKREDLEAWLERALVPVEPNPRFVRRLRGRLVHVRGQGLLSLWVVILILATVALTLATWLGLILRLALAIVGFVGFLQRQRRGQLKTTA